MSEPIEATVPRVTEGPWEAHGYGPSCAHITGIEHVVVTQSGGAKYEWWRCGSCRTEFRATGSPAHGEASNSVDRP